MLKSSAHNKIQQRVVIASLAIMLSVFFSPAWAQPVLSPEDFERIWLLNNQRNLIKRYQQHNQLFQQNKTPYMSMDIDAADNKTIRTTAGDSEAILDRMSIYYQDPNYLFLIDWLSLIPQPQTTEGFTYGDTVLGYTWHKTKNSQLTMGGRLQSTPKTAIINNETVFNLTENATSDDLSGFIHLNYDGWDFGTYYSDENGTQATAFNIPIYKTSTQKMSAGLTYLGGAPDIDIAPRYELSIDHSFLLQQHKIRSSLTVTSLSGENNTDLSNAYLQYTSPTNNSIRYSAGLFYYYDLENNERLPGAKLGVEYILQSQDELSIGFFIRKNAFGDIDAMMVKDEPVISFNLSMRPQF